MKAKEDENKALSTSLKEAQVKVKAADGMATELAGLRADVAKRDAEKERGEAFATAGIPDKVRSGFEALYASAVASADEGKAPTFAAWLESEDTKGHPLLADHYGKGSTEAHVDKPNGAPADKGNGAPADKSKVPPKHTGGLTNTGRGTGTPAGGTVIDSPAKLSTYLRSDSYRALSKEDQKKELAELQGQLSTLAGQG